MEDACSKYRGFKNVMQKPAKVASLLPKINQSFIKTYIAVGNPLQI